MLSGERGNHVRWDAGVLAGCGVSTWMHATCRTNVGSSLALPGSWATYFIRLDLTAGIIIDTPRRLSIETTLSYMVLAHGRYWVNGHSCSTSLQRWWKNLELALLFFRQACVL